jgi:hypothetical protein
VDVAREEDDDDDEAIAAGFTPYPPIAHANKLVPVV